MSAWKALGTVFRQAGQTLEALGASLQGTGRETGPKPILRREGRDHRKYRTGTCICCSERNRREDSDIAACATTLSSASCWAKRNRVVVLQYFNYKYFSLCCSIEAQNSAVVRPESAIAGRGWLCRTQRVLDRCRQPGNRILGVVRRCSKR